MTREEIEKISVSRPHCFERYFEKIWYEVGCIDGLKAADAEPNLKSLWHDASEEPQGPYIILCDGLDNRQWVVEWLYIDMSYANWQDYVERIDVSRWAYISDLLPKGDIK